MKTLRIFRCRASLRNLNRINANGWRIVWSGEGLFGFSVK